MAKAKSQKGGGVHQKHLHSRISFLYQAAESLDAARASASKSSLNEPDSRKSFACAQELSSVKSERMPKQSLFLLSQLRAVSQKSQIRLSPQLKRTVCKRCNARLFPGKTSHEELENLSVGHRKPWADVLVVTCLVCGTKKRFPIGACKSWKKVTETGHLYDGESAHAVDGRMETDFIMCQDNGSC